MSALHGVYGGPRAAPPPPPSGPAVTTSGVHMGQVFNYNESYPNGKVIGEDGIDYVWGAQDNAGVDVPAVVPNWHEIYWPWGRVDHPHITAAAMPDQTWVMYQADRVTPCNAFGDGIASIDMTNPACQSYVANKLIPYLQNGFKGISFDNSITDWSSGNANPAGHFNASSAWVGQYTGNNATYWNAQITAFQAVMALIRNAVPGAWATPNQGFTTPDWLGPQATANMYFDEGGLTKFGTGYQTSTGGDWVARMNGYVTLQKGGTGLVLVNEEPYTATDYMTDSNMTARFDLQWTLANYLLVKYSHTYFWFGGSQQYGRAPTKQHEYATASTMGVATGDFYSWSSVYRRDFTNGMALVNPDPTTTFGVTLPRTYHDLYGAAVTAPSLPAHSGLVLTF